jgi:hypothetical protein
MNVSKHEDSLCVCMCTLKESDGRRRSIFQFRESRARDITKVFQECKVLRGALLLFFSSILSTKRKGKEAGYLIIIMPYVAAASALISIDSLI